MTVLVAFLSASSSPAAPTHLVKGVIRQTEVARPNALWRVVHGLCVRDMRLSGHPAPCVEVNVGGGYAVLKDIEHDTQLLLIHATVHNHFNQERHLVSREIYKQRRSAALAEWRSVMGQRHLGLGSLCLTGDELPLD